MIKIIDYIEVCSESLLATYDQVDRKYDSNDRLYLDLTPINKQLLEFHIISNLKSCYYYGYKNIILNTCRPYDNWRKNKTQVVKAVKYCLNDDMLYIDKQKLEYFLDSIWKKLNKNLEYNYILLNNHKVDLIDFQYIIENIIGTKLKKVPSYYHILKDSNNEYIHNGPIPKFILDEVEFELRKNKLII